MTVKIPIAQKLMPKTTGNVPSGAFSYKKLGAVAVEAQAAAQRIRQHMHHTNMSIFEIGNDLRQIKDKLQHGQFGKWIAAEFAMSERTAQRYMNIAERFENKQELLKLLPVSVIYALAAPSTPAGFTEMKLLEIEDGNIPTGHSIANEIAIAKQDAAPPKQVKASSATQPLTEEQAAFKAVALLRKRLGSSFPEFIELFGQTAVQHFAWALDEAVASDAS